MHEISTFDGNELKVYYLPADTYTAQEALQIIKEQFPGLIVTYERSIV